MVNEVIRGLKQDTKFLTSETSVILLTLRLSCLHNFPPHSAVYSVYSYHNSLVPRTESYSNLNLSLEVQVPTLAPELVILTGRNKQLRGRYSLSKKLRQII